MKSIEIKNFKGLGSLKISDLPLSSGNQVFNALIYGENGMGKTSFTEAIRLSKFYDKLEKNVIPDYVIDPERTYQRDTWMRSYMNDKSQNDFSINIDNNIFNSSAPTNSIISQGVYIIDRTLLQSTPEINLTNLITEVNFSFHNPISHLFSIPIIDLVISDVNQILKSEFREEIELKRSQSNSLLIVVHDHQTNESFENVIDKRFNEAKQNLIKILLVMAYIKLDKKESDIILLDDIVISLDIANRIILVDYILNRMNKCQVIILTHSFGLFNLISHHIAATNKNEEWRTGSLYNINNTHGVTVYPIVKENKKAKEFKRQLATATDIHTIDIENQVRQHLELLLHEFAKVLTIGNHEEAKDMISKIESSPNELYFSVNGNSIETIYDLVRHIKSLVVLGDPKTILQKLKRLFNQFSSTNEIHHISTVIKKVDSYQKVVLHTGSHYQSGTLKPITKKELVIAIELIEKLENIVYQPTTKYPHDI